MGFNTTVVILNDALHAIEKDPEFGKKLSNAVLRSISRQDCPVHFSAGCSDAGSVIETHHADQDVLVSVGENTGVVVHDDMWGKDTLVSIKEISERLGVSRDRAQVIAWGALRAKKLAGRYIVLRRDFDRYLANLKWEKAHAKKK
jgi:hypothetical protein